METDAHHRSGKPGDDFLPLTSRPLRFV